MAQHQVKDGIQNVASQLLIPRKPVPKNESFHAHPINMTIAEPGTPKQLQRSKLTLLFSFLSVLAPLFFIGLSILSATLHHKQISDLGHRVQQTLLLAPTVFPIVFAALCGRMMRSIAAYGSQTGLKLGLIEHLVGFQSLFSALERLFVIRNFGIFGLSIALIWLCSPVGGQAFLRVLTTEMHRETLIQPASFLGPGFLNNTEFLSAPSQWVSLSYMTQLYLSSLSEPASIKASTRDLWVNPKVPSPKSLNGSLVYTSADWLNISTDRPSRYMNLLGIPIGKLSANSRSKLKIESLQMNIRCTNSQVVPSGWKSDNDTFYNGTHVAKGAFHFLEGYQIGIPTSYLYLSNSSYNSFLENESHPLIIYYGSKTYGPRDPNAGYTEWKISLITCNLTPFMLESRAECDGSECSIVAMRQSPKEMNDRQKETLKIAITNGGFCGMGLSLRLDESSQPEHFLASPRYPNSNILAVGFVDLWNVSLDAFEDRFMLAFNTYYYAASSTIFSEEVNMFGEGPLEELGLLNTTATVVDELGNRYVCHKVWVAIAFTISIILELTAVTSAVLSFFTQAPDLLGHVSSVTLDNTNFKQQTNGLSTALDGLERARMMKDVQIVLVDVQGQEAVGRIAFVARVEKGSKALVPSRIQFGRSYQ